MDVVFSLDIQAISRISDMNRSWSRSANMGDLILTWTTFLGGVVGAAVGFIVILVVGILLVIPYWMVTRRDQLDPRPEEGSH